MSDRKENQYNVLPKTILCPHCLAKNPMRAYVCLTCFRLIRPKQKFPWWKQAFQGTRAIFLLMVLFCLIAGISIRRWLVDVEDQLENIQEQNAQYHQAMSDYMRLKVEHHKNNGNSLPQEISDFGALEDTSASP